MTQNLTLLLNILGKMSEDGDSRSNNSSKTSRSLLSMESKSYDLLTKSKLGYAVIFNNENFKDKGTG